MSDKKLKEALRAFRAFAKWARRGAAEDITFPFDARESSPKKAKQGTLDFVESKEGESDFKIEFIELRERAISDVGDATIKLIQPGQGSSGFYPKEVLQRDGPNVFGAGLQMFWNHATDSDEFQRPEGDMDYLAGVLTTSAKYQDGPAGEGLYADAKVFTKYRETLNELAPYTGVSIRGRAIFEDTEVNGAPVRMIKELLSAKSVDFVTKPGAGGKIIEAFEAARAGEPRPSANPAGNNQEVTEVTQEELQALEAKITKLTERVDSLEAENKSLREADAQRSAREKEAAILQQARQIVTVKLKESSLPDITQARLADQLSGNPPVKDNALDQPALEERIKTAAEGETAYLAAVGGRTVVTGMGGGAAVFEADKAPERMEAAFARLGMGEKEAKIAATGTVQ